MARNGNILVEVAEVKDITFVCNDGTALYLAGTSKEMYEIRMNPANWGVRGDDL